MWDFEHAPLAAELATRYSIEWMLPSECADRLASGSADIGLVPIAALPFHPHLRILPGCTIASKDYVRSLVLVRRAGQPVDAIRTVAADTASRTTIAHARILFRQWGNAQAQFVPMAANLEDMLERADAAILIGDPALLVMERAAQSAAPVTARDGEELVLHDLAHEWRSLTGHPFVSAVWAVGEAVPADCLEAMAQDFARSRDHGLAHMDALAQEWSERLPLSEAAVSSYLTRNIHYVLDEECLGGMATFFRMGEEASILPAYDFARLPALR